MNVILSREECLACLIALEQEKKPYKWQQQAIKKLETASHFGINRKEFPAPMGRGR